MTGVSLPMERFLLEAPARIPNLAGIKFTNPDLVSYRRSLDAAGARFDLPWGVDEALLGGLATGARGGVGSTYNWAPKLYGDLMSAFNRGDVTEARRLQSLSIAMIDAIARTGFMGTAKALMGRLGVPVGPARAPLGNPTDAQVDALMARLAELGFDQWGPQSSGVISACGACLVCWTPVYLFGPRSLSNRSTSRFSHIVVSVLYDERLPRTMPSSSMIT